MQACNVVTRLFVFSSQHVYAVIFEGHKICEFYKYYLYCDVNISPSSCEKSKVVKLKTNFLISLFMNFCPSNITAYMAVSEASSHNNGTKHYYMHTGTNYSSMEPTMLYSYSHCIKGTYTTCW